MGYQNILVTLDGSKLAEQALGHALKVANMGAAIHILSIKATGESSESAAMGSAAIQSNPDPASTWPPIPKPDLSAGGDARTTYQEQIREWLEQSGYHAAIETITSDSVIDAIAEVAGRGFDVLIMATHWRTGAARTVVGSVTAGVLERVTIPVLVIPVK